ncbi:MAG: histidinol-phosphate aminotransferase [delta proteobacterium MLS_D]|jgi:histidinol-phosphate aminotransferase|nr:MAG: histidinol-phosphate aminotransferase [delta proteobacterium MLS_D]
MNKFWSDCIRGLQPYTPGEQPRIRGLIKLNTNENPYPPSPAAIDAIRKAACGDLRLYPDPEGTELQRTIAGVYGLSEGQVFLGNGSDEVLAFAFLALLKHERPVFFPDITYSFYPVYCALFDIAYETIPLDGTFRVDIDDYRRPNGGVVLANPNAPTGSALGREEIGALLEMTPGSVVIVDEAYVDFGAESVVSLVTDFDTLLVVRTLSKSHSLAGLRVGFAMGNPSLIEALRLVKNCFNSYPLDRLALAGAEAALRDSDYFEETRRKIMADRERLAVGLSALGFDVLPSSANFLFVSHSDYDAAELMRLLRERRILVRHFKGERISRFLRISVGLLEECDALVDALREIIGQRPAI